MQKVQKSNGLTVSAGYRRKTQNLASIAKIAFCQLIALCFLLSTAAYAYDSGEIIVTGVADPVTLAETGSSVVVISSDEIQKKNPSSIEELLRNIPSLSVYSTGAGTLSVGIRGAATRYTMIMIDGVPFEDPTGMGGSDLWMPPPSMVDRIEIVSGPASAMYGSGAMSGVVNIITKKEDLKGATISAGIGSYSAYNFSAGAANEYLTVGGDYHTERGISTQTDNKERDPFTTGSVFAKQYATAGSYKHTIFAAYKNNRYNFDPGDSYSDSHTYQLLFTPSFMVNDYWTPSITAGYIEAYREIYDSSALVWGLAPDSSYRGVTQFIELNNKIKLREIIALSAGGKWSQDSAKTTYTVDTRYASTAEEFLNAVIKPLDGWNIFAGSRYVDIRANDKIESKLVYSANTSYMIEPINLTIKGGYGTAFKAPTLEQLYSPVYGSKDLRYEKSAIWEAGFRHSVSDDTVIWGLTYFDSKYDDQIYFDSASNSFKNRDSKSSGVEAELNIYVSIFEFDAAYTHADIKDRNDSVKVKALRRPQNKFRAALSAYPVAGFSATIETVYTDKTDDEEYDIFWTAVPITNKSYTLVNFYTSYDVDETLNVYGKILNLTDEKYTTAAGYNNKRIDLQAGVKYNF